MPKLNKTKNNDYINNQKETCIETPDPICECLFDNLKDKINKKTIIVDVGCSRGNLSRKFYENGHKVVGIDIDNFEKDFNGKFYQCDFFKSDFLLKKIIKGNNDFLVLCNEPWNNPKKIKHLSEKETNEIDSFNSGKVKEINKKINDLMENKKLTQQEAKDIILGKKYEWNGLKYFPEMFMKKIFSLFGENVPVVLLTIYGFMMNNGINSKRYKWLRDSNFKINSILEMPKDAFKNQGVDIWNHIVFFNINGLDPIWFLEEKYLKKLRRR